MTPLGVDPYRAYTREEAERFLWTPGQLGKTDDGRVWIFANVATAHDVLANMFCVLRFPLQNNWQAVNGGLNLYRMNPFYLARAGWNPCGIVYSDVKQNTEHVWMQIYGPGEVRFSGASAKTVSQTIRTTNTQGTLTAGVTGDIMHRIALTEDISGGNQIGKVFLMWPNGEN